MKRMVFLRELRRLITLYGSENIVYFDKSSFKKHSYRAHGWAVHGKKIYGDVSGNNHKCTNLLVAQHAKKWLAPMLFECFCYSLVVNAWLKERLLPLLKKPSIVIMDNAVFHKKKEIIAIIEKHGHVLLPLPSYSPDFNPIEKSFGVLKRKREFAPPNTSITQLIISSNSYLE